MMDLDRKIAIVTGAGTGIGRGIATVLAAHGATVVCSDIREAAAADTARTIAGKGGQSLALAQDVSSWDSTSKAVDDVMERFGQIDILVNNAGVSKSVPFHELDAAEWDRVNDVNIKGVFISCRAVVPHMMKRKYGKIVNISSMAGKEGFPTFVHYCSTKFAVIGLTQALAKEMAPYNINVNAVCPGVVRTPLWDPLLTQLAANNRVTQEKAWGDFVEGAPFKRPQEPEDIGEAVAFYASDRARNITAAAENVSGGQVLW